MMFKSSAMVYCFSKSFSSETISSEILNDVQILCHGVLLQQILFLWNNLLWGPSQDLISDSKLWEPVCQQNSTQKYLLQTLPGSSRTNVLFHHPLPHSNPFPLHTAIPFLFSKPPLLRKNSTIAESSSIEKKWGLLVSNLQVSVPQAWPPHCALSLQLCALQISSCSCDLHRWTKQPDPWDDTACNGSHLISFQKTDFHIQNPCSQTESGILHGYSWYAFALWIDRRKPSHTGHTGNLSARWYGRWHDRQGDRLVWTFCHTRDRCAASQQTGQCPSASGSP